MLMYARDAKKFCPAQVREMIWRGSAGAAALIACQPQGIPAVGQYVLAWSLEEPDAPLATPLFPGGLAQPPLAGAAQDGFQAASAPHTWAPGMALRLCGPLGRGFQPPAGLRRLALAALGELADRLLPLAGQALEQGAAVAVFADCLLPGLPAAVEVQPLSALPEATGWADYLALDLPAERLPGLRQALGLPAEQSGVPCPAQALVATALPCGGLADCGACAIETRRGWKNACESGPVFDVGELLWTEDRKR